ARALACWISNKSRTRAYPLSLMHSETPAQSTCSNWSLRLIMGHFDENGDQFLRFAEKGGMAGVHPVHFFTWGLVVHFLLYEGGDRPVLGTLDIIPRYAAVIGLGKDKRHQGRLQRFMAQNHFGQFHNTLIAIMI